MARAGRPSCIEPCIPSGRSRKDPYACHNAVYRERHKVENFFAKLKGLATHRNPLRPYILFRYPLRRNRHLLALIKVP
jgi:hypothetical protein